MGGARPVISFLSDYGLADEFVGVCHGVIARRCPQARVIDVTHAIPPQALRTGAAMLRDCVRFLPAGVHLAVVDPGVGATGGVGLRRAVALRAAEQERLLVGPDNGLLMPAAEALGGVVEAIDIGSSPECLTPVSRTFHGRDIFAPVAAALAAGAELGAIGESLAVEMLVQLRLPCAKVRGQAIDAHVLRIDRFGNVMLDARWEQLRQLGLRARGRVSLELGGLARDSGSHGGAGDLPLALCVHTFSEVAPGELLLYEDSRGMLALAVNEGSAAAALGVYGEGAQPITIRPR